MTKPKNVELIKNVLEKLSGLYSIRDEIIHFCKKYGIKSYVTIEYDSFRDNTKDNIETEGPLTFHIGVDHVTTENLRGLPYVISDDSFYHQNNYRVYFVNGPIISMLHIKPIEISDSIKYCGIIDVATRGLNPSKEVCTCWHLEIRVTCYGDDQSSENINKSLEDQINRIGKSTITNTLENNLSSFHFMLSHTLAKNIKAADIVYQLSRGKLELSDCFMLLGMSKSRKDTILRSLRSLKDGDTLTTLMYQYFFSFDDIRIQRLSDFSFFVDLCQDSVEFTPGDPFDFIRLMFTILSIVMKEVKSAENEIKEMCGDQYNSVVETILCHQYPLSDYSDYSDINDLSLVIPLGYGELVLDKTIKRWEDRFESVGAYIDESGDTIRKYIHPGISLDSIRNFIDQSWDFVGEAIETYLRKKRGIVFRKPYKKIEGDLLKSLSYLSNKGKQELSENEAAAVHIHNSYIKSFSNLCWTLRRYLRSVFP